MRERAVTGVAVAVLTAVSYLCWLGWDQEYDRHPDGHLTGPYQAWQVVGLAACIGVGAAWAGWRRHPWVGALVSSVVLTTCWSVDAATDEPNQGLWPIGAFFVSMGSLFGTTLVALLVAERARQSATDSGTASDFSMSSP